jgi:hypothetical protein
MRSRVSLCPNSLQTRVPSFSATTAQQSLRLSTTGWATNAVLATPTTLMNSVFSTDPKAKKQLTRYSTRKRKLDQERLSPQARLRRSFSFLLGITSNQISQNRPGYQLNFQHFRFRCRSFPADHGYPRCHKCRSFRLYHTSLSSRKCLNSLRSIGFRKCHKCPTRRRSCSSVSANPWMPI